MIEMITYIALLLALAGIVGGLVYLGTTSYQKSQMQTTVNQDLRVLEGIIRQKVANAIGVESIATSTLVLIMSASSANPTRIYLEDDSLWLKEGSDAPKLLTASSVISVATTIPQIFSKVQPTFFNIHDFYSWAWNDGVGWIDFTPLLGRPIVSLSGRELSGLAYIMSHRNNESGNIDDGWIILNCGSLETDICQTSNFKVSYNPNTGTTSGWAWNGRYGWISFSCETGSDRGQDICSSSNYKVIIASSTGEFSGWAWSSGATTTANEGFGGLGWISFNCSGGGAAGNNICSSSSYKVQDKRLLQSGIRVQLTLNYKNPPRLNLSTSASSDFTVTVREAGDLKISSINPSSGASGSVVGPITININSGSTGRASSTARVRLEKSGELEVYPSTPFTCSDCPTGLILDGGRFNLSNVPTGVWKLLVINPSGELGTATFTVTAAQ